MNRPGVGIATWRSSDRSSRAFSPICGSTSGATDGATVVALVSGCFDARKRKALAPESHSHVSPRPRWWHVQIGGRPADP